MIERIIIAERGAEFTRYMRGVWGSNVFSDHESFSENDASFKSWYAEGLVGIIADKIECETETREELKDEQKNSRHYFDQDEK